MVETQGLTHINLLVADVHRAKAFYERVFGLQELFWDGPGMVFSKTARHPRHHNSSAEPRRIWWDRQH